MSELANDQEIIIKPKKKLSFKKKVFLVVGLILVFAAIGYYVNLKLNSNTKINYLTLPAEIADVTDAIQATGTLSPVKKSELGFKNSENIVALNVQPGDWVEEGQILAAQDSKNLNYSVQQAENQLNQEKVAQEIILFNLDKAKTNLDQQQSLFDAGAIPKTTLDQAQNDYNKLQLDLETSRVKMTNSQAQLEQAKANLSNAVLKAPFSGRVGSVNGQIGQIIGVNSSGSSSLITVISEELELSALVNEVDVGRVQVGQSVEFTAGAHPGKRFAGKVERINPESTTVSNVQFYSVLISCQDQEKLLKPGMSVTADIIIARRENVMTIPALAVSYAQKNSQPASGTEGAEKRTATADAQSNNANANESMPAGATKAMVMLLENNQPIKRSVTLGLNDGQNYEVIEGISAGESIVIGESAGTNAARNNGTTGNQGGNSNNNQNRTGGGPMMIR